MSYILSFIYVGIYWNNHHHLMHTVREINGKILWANLHLLFWLSLIPFVTGWLGVNDFAQLPMALYGVVLLMAAIAYSILQRSTLTVHGSDSILARALGRDIKGKISPVLYSIAIVGAFYSAWVAAIIYVLVALMWLVPDNRIEGVYRETAIDAD